MDAAGAIIDQPEELFPSGAFLRAFSQHAFTSRLGSRRAGESPAARDVRQVQCPRTQRRRGNPKWKNSEFQQRMANRRWHPAVKGSDEAEKADEDTPVDDND